MEAGDADSNAVVAGSLLGARFGFSNLPQDWLDKLPPAQYQWMDRKIASFLHMLGLEDEVAPSMLPANRDLSPISYSDFEESMETPGISRALAQDTPDGYLSRLQQVREEPCDDQPIVNHATQESSQEKDPSELSIADMAQPVTDISQLVQAVRHRNAFEASEVPTVTGSSHEQHAMPSTLSVLEKLQ